MSTYKVLQDIEAEDKLIGPLTLRQFIYACIGAGCMYLSFLCVTKGAAFMLAIFLPVVGITGFFAFPWTQDQPTEVWALAKIRFALKPRKRIWDQSNAKELVTITVPKKIERFLTNGLDQDQVHDRLSALASTIDSRGWAIKNINVNMNSGAVVSPMDISDRLVQPSSLPQQVSDFDVRASDDILDPYANPVAQQLDSMITASASAHRQQLMAQMRQPTAAALPVPTPLPTSPAPQVPAAGWFLQPTTNVPSQAAFVGSTAVATLGVPQAATPTAEEEALVARLKAANSNQTVAYGNLRTVKTPQQLIAEDAAQRAAAATAKATVTPKEQAAIMNLAINDDLDVATLARQAHKEVEQSDGEVIISLH